MWPNGPFYFILHTQRVAVLRVHLVTNPTIISPRISHASEPPLSSNCKLDNHPKMLVKTLRNVREWKKEMTRTTRYATCHTLVPGEKIMYFSQTYYFIALLKTNYDASENKKMAFTRQYIIQHLYPPLHKWCIPRFSWSVQVYSNIKLLIRSSSSSTYVFQVWQAMLW